MTSQTRHSVLRYWPIQRALHWMGATGFVLLLLTGLALLFPPLSFLAAGGMSRQIHLIGAVLFIAWPVLYAILDGKEFKHLLIESFTYDRDDIEWFKHMPGYFFGRTAHLPPQGRFNAGQKLHHAGTMLGYLTVAVSGIALWHFKGELGADHLAIIAMLHDLSMLALAVLLVGHIYFTLVYDALSGMVSGYVTEAYARMEHAKWFARLPRREPYIVTQHTPPKPNNDNHVPHG